MAINNVEAANEDQEKKKNSNVEDVKTKFIKDYVREKTQANDVAFIDSIVNNDTIPWVVWLEADLQRYKSGNDEFSQLKLEEINIFDLKRAVWKDYMRLNNARNNLNGVLQRDFEIDKSIRDSVNKEINKLTVDKLDELTNSNKKATDFLRKINSGIEPRIKKEALKFLNILSDQEVVSRLDNIERIHWKNKRQEVKSILYDISIYRIIDTDIIMLFELDFFTDEEKRYLVETFIPTITLQRAIDIWLIDKAEAKLTKEKLLKESLSWKWFTDSQIERIIDNASFSDIVLSTNDFLSKIDSVNKLWIEVWFKNLENDFRELIEESKKNIKDEWPQTFADMLVFMQEINIGNRFQNLDKFKKGNVYKLTLKGQDWKDAISYFKIVSIDDKNKEFWLQLIGDWKQISSSILNKGIDPDLQTLTYAELKNFLQKDTYAKLDFFTTEEIDKKIESKELWNFDYTRISESYLQEHKGELISEYVNKLEKEIDELKVKIEGNKEDKTLKKLLEQKEYLLKSYRDDLSDDSLLSLVNREKFIDKLDEADPQWAKIWFEKWIFIESKWAVYEVIWINTDWNIQLKSRAWLEWTNGELPFEVFFENFKKNNAKRLSRIDGFSNLIDLKKSSSVTPKSGGDKKAAPVENNWKDYEFSGWKIIAKNVDHLGRKSDEVVEYLVSDSKNDIIKICDISWNNVTIQFWERKDFSSLSESEKKKDKIKDKTKWEKIYLDSRQETISLNELDLYINKYELYPNWKTWKTLKTEEPMDPQNPRHGGFFTRLFNRTSFNELIAWWNLLVEWVKESMKRWNDLHAAQFALKLWKFLPAEIKEDMLIKVESAESAEMTKALEWLWKVDSPIATKRIKKWLNNRDTPEYKKEAWLLFMLEKYWHLSAKWALYEFRWKWKWYEAFWWRVWDELYLEIEKEAKDSNVTFSEEKLMHILLKKQCDSTSSVYPKRRSRLHKEFEWKWKSWVDAEIKKWYDDATNKRTARDMYLWWNDEAHWWTHSNAVWWYKKAIERWWSLEDMSRWFFSLLYSWALYNIDQTTFTKIKSLWDWDWMPMIMARFSSYKSDMVLFNKVVLEISKKIEIAYWDKFKWIWPKAQQLYDDAINGVWKESERFDRSVDFWETYWTPLVRSLNMANLEDSTYSKTDKIILLEKDKEPVFKEYFDKVRWRSNEIEFKEELMTDWFTDSWVTWLSTYEVARKTLKINNSWGFTKPKGWKQNWKEISGDINNTPNKIFDYNSNSPDTNENRVIQKKYLIGILKDLIAWLIENAWSNERVLAWYNNLTAETWYDLDKWWINFMRDFWGKYNSTRILKWDADWVISTYADRILSWGSSGTSPYHNPLEEVKAHSRTNVTNSLNSSFDDLDGL